MTMTLKMKRMNLPSVLVADHLDRDLFAGSVPGTANPILVHPGLKFAHPIIINDISKSRDKGTHVNNILNIKDNRSKRCSCLQGKERKDHKHKDEMGTEDML